VRQQERGHYDHAERARGVNSPSLSGILAGDQVQVSGTQDGTNTVNAASVATVPANSGRGGHGRFGGHGGRGGHGGHGAGGAAV
jgi:hypothetical protein